MFGFDYGRKINVQIIENANVKDNALKMLKEFEGLYYTATEDNKLTLGIVFNTKYAAEIGYQIFKEEINNEEIFEFNFIDHSNDNGYTFILKESEKMDKNIISSYSKKLIQPMFMILMHSKTFPNRSEGYLLFKELKKNNTCEIKFLYKDNFRIKMLNTPSINKDKIQYYKEDEIPEDSALFYYYHKIKPEKDKFEKEDIQIRRVENIKYFFPITYEKIETENFLKNKIELLTKYDNSIVLQAICNIILKYRFEKIGIKLAKLSQQEIVEYLEKEFENFESLYPDEDYFTLTKIEKQIFWDKNLTEKKKKTQEIKEEKSNKKGKQNFKNKKKRR